MNPAIREPHRFYPKFASSVLKFIFRYHLAPDTGSVLIFTDTLPVAKHREAAEKAIKTACRHELDPAIRFESYHHPAASNAWIQAADYCSWAIFKKWEHGDERTYGILSARLAARELDALRLGTMEYY